MIHKLQICIYLFRSLIEIVDQNELFIQMNCRILCGQSNQIQITISLFHIFIFIFIFNLSISKLGILVNISAIYYPLEQNILPLGDMTCRINRELCSEIKNKSLKISWNNEQIDYHDYRRRNALCLR